MFIQVEQTPNPRSLKFLPNQPVLPEDATSGWFTQKSQYKDWQISPLAKKLFAVEGIEGIFLGKDYVTITRGAEDSWTILQPQIYTVLMDFFASGEPTLAKAGEIVSDTTITEDDDEVVALIKELLETRIRPAVQEDGGDLFYKSFDPETGVVKLQLAGSCSGCPSSSVTLKQGVENMLKHYIPEVTSVEEFVDEDVKAASDKALSSLEQRLKAAGIPFDH